MRAVQIAGGKVVNVAIADEGQTLPEDWMFSDVAEIGWDVVDGTPVAPPPVVAPVEIPNLTFPQLLFGLVTEGLITDQEGNDWLINRTLPAAIEGFISALPPTQQLLVRARALQPTTVLYSDPMVQGLGAANGKTPEEMAAFFTAYAQV